MCRSGLAGLTMSSLLGSASSDERTLIAAIRMCVGVFACVGACMPQLERRVGACLPRLERRVGMSSGASVPLFQ